MNGDDQEGCEAPHYQETATVRFCVECLRRIIARAANEHFRLGPGMQFEEGDVTFEVEYEGRRPTALRSAVLHRQVHSEQRRLDS